MPVEELITAKVCSQCKAEKPIEDFYPKSGGKGGVSAECKSCAAIRKKKFYQIDRSNILEQKARYYVEHKEQILQRKFTEYYTTGRQKKKEHRDNARAADPRLFKVQEMLTHARRRSKSKDIEFKITEADLGDWRTIESCPVLGIQLAWENPALQADSPTIDRIKNNLGYVPENVRIISWRANRLKSDATPEELRKISQHAA
jgi:hypothetical protein